MRTKGELWRMERREGLGFLAGLPLLEEADQIPEGRVADELSEGREADELPEGRGADELPGRRGGR